jgi:hypothetical protein
MCKKPSFSPHKKFLKTKQNIRYLTGIMRGLLLGGKSATKANCALVGKLSGICYRILGKILELNNFQNHVEINFEVPLYTH